MITPSVLRASPPHPQNLSLCPSGVQTRPQQSTHKWAIEPLTINIPVSHRVHPNTISLPTFQRGHTRWHRDMWTIKPSPKTEMRCFSCREQGRKSAMGWSRAETKGNSFDSAMQFLSDKGLPAQICDVLTNPSFCDGLKLKCQKQSLCKPDTHKGRQTPSLPNPGTDPCHGLSCSPADTVADVPRAFPGLWGCSVKCRCCLWAPALL